MFSNLIDARANLPNALTHGNKQTLQFGRPQRRKLFSGNMATLLAKGADAVIVSNPLFEGYTPLICILEAAEMDAIPMMRSLKMVVKLLLDHGANVFYVTPSRPTVVHKLLGMMEKNKNCNTLESIFAILIEHSTDLSISHRGGVSIARRHILAANIQPKVERLLVAGNTTIAYVEVNDCLFILCSLPDCPTILRHVQHTEALSRYYIDKIWYAIRRRSLQRYSRILGPKFSWSK